MKALFVLLFLGVLATPSFAAIFFDYSPNQTVELYREYFVNVTVSSNYTDLVEIGFGTPENWLSLNQTNFNLNFTENNTFQVKINATVDIGTFKRKIPVFVSWYGGMYNTTLGFNISTIEPQTVLSVNVFITAFSISMFKTDIGVMKITNNGTVPAFNVSIWDDFGWLGFDDANFTIQINSSEVVEFVVRPNITRTDQTNTTHNITMYIMATNSNALEVPIYVTIPWFDFGNLTCDFFWEQQKYFEKKKTFCDAYPTAADCLTSPVPLEKNVTLYVKLPCNLENLTEEDMNAYGVCRRDLEDLQFKFDLISDNNTALLREIDRMNRVQTPMIEGLGGQYTGWTILLLLIICFGAGAGGVIFIKRLRGW